MRSASSRPNGFTLLEITVVVTVVGIVTAFADAPCNLCQISQGGLQYFKVNHAITSTATRVENLGTDDEIPLGRKTVSVMVDIQPMELLPLDLTFDRTDADSNGVADVLEGLKS